MIKVSEIFVEWILKLEQSYLQLFLSVLDIWWLALKNEISILDQFIVLHV